MSIIPGLLHFQPCVLMKVPLSVLIANLQKGFEPKYNRQSFVDTNFIAESKALVT